MSRVNKKDVVLSKDVENSQVNILQATLYDLAVFLGGSLGQLKQSLGVRFDERTFHGATKKLFIGIQ